MSLRDDFDDVWRYLAAPRDPEGLAFDGRYGTETRWFDAFGNYEPSRPSVVEAALDALDVDPAEFTFVDVGSGKGRVLILAAQRAFRDVLGIEPDRGLRAVAARNLAAASRVAPAVARPASKPEMRITSGCRTSRWCCSSTTRSRRRRSAR